MQTEIQQRCETIEECYEFTLSYAAQGHSSDEGSASGPQLREHLTHAVEALAGMEASCAATVRDQQLEPAAKYEAYFAILVRDAEAARTAIELVLAQPAISSQLIDNLNASIHLRALLTDLFLVTEILGAIQTRASAAVAQ